MIENIEESLGLKLKIDGIADADMMVGGVSFVLYLHIDNIKQENRVVNILKTTYVTKSREHFEQDFWDSGYLSEKGVLKPNSINKVGLGFYKSKLKKISNSDTIYITIELQEEGAEVVICFIRIEDSWQVIESKKTLTEKAINLNPALLAKSLFKKIERLEAFEERLNVRFENISIKIHLDNWVKVILELHSNNGITIDQSIRVECVAYDIDGQILCVSNCNVNNDTFFGFEILEFYFNEDWIADKINKLRLYPKKR